MEWKHAQKIINLHFEVCQKHGNGRGNWSSKSIETRFFKLKYLMELPVAVILWFIYLLNDAVSVNAFFFVRSVVSFTRQFAELRMIRQIELLLPGTLQRKFNFSIDFRMGEERGNWSLQLNPICNVFILPYKLKYFFNCCPCCNLRCVLSVIRWINFSHAWYELTSHGI